MQASTHFIWGPGGVGKSHLAIRLVARNSKKSSLITLDPSLRVLELLGCRGIPEKPVNLGDYRISIKTSSAMKIFEDLEKVRPAHPAVRLFFERMIKGLQEFRDYLTLIQLSGEIAKTSDDVLFIDTPPFQEAVGIHRAIFQLKSFFEKALVQMAFRATQGKLVHQTIKKVFEVTRVFVGKKTADNIFEFLDWLSYHTEHFQKSADQLEKLVHSPTTHHCFIVTPESKISFLDEIQNYFKKSSRHFFFINRSVEGYELPEGDDPFLREIQNLQKKERKLVQEIKRRFTTSPIERIPLILMGEDTPEELLRFINA